MSTSVDGPVCPRCGGNRYEVTNGPRIDRYCFRCNGRVAYHEIIYTDMPKPRVVIEVKDGQLLTVFSNVDAEFILIDHDEFDGGRASSAVIIPDFIRDIPEKTKVLAEDAVRRNQS